MFSLINYISTKIWTLKIFSNLNLIYLSWCALLTPVLLMNSKSGFALNVGLGSLGSLGLIE